MDKTKRSDSRLIGLIVLNILEKVFDWPRLIVFLRLLNVITSFTAVSLYKLVAFCREGSVFTSEEYSIGATRKKALLLILIRC